MGDDRHTLEYWRGKARGYQMAAEQAQKGMRRLKRRVERLEQVVKMMEEVMDGERESAQEAAHRPL